MAQVAAASALLLKDRAEHPVLLVRPGPPPPADAPLPERLFTQANTALRLAADRVWAEHFDRGALGNDAAPAATWRDARRLLVDARRAGSPRLQILVDSGTGAGADSDALAAQVRAWARPTDSVATDRLAPAKHPRPRRAVPAAPSDTAHDAAAGGKRPRSPGTSAPAPPPRPPRFMRSECFEDAVDDSGPAPFAGLHLAPFDGLDAATQQPRVPCPRCHHPGKHYCKECLQPLLPAPYALPTVRLPLPLIMLKHGGEHSSKSTAVHALVVAGADTHLVDYPKACQRDHLRALCGRPAQPSETAADVDAALAHIRATSVILYPADDAVAFDAMPPAERARVERIFVVDGTWTSVKPMVTDLQDHLGGPLRAVTLAHAGRTHFWRPNGTDNAAHLSTIEAVHAVYREYALAQGAAPDAPEVAQLDNLLYLFAYQHRLVSDAMRARLAKRAGAAPSAADA